MSSLQNFILIAPILLFSMVAHEYAHGYAALKNGDMTAYQLGRLTWNPLKHIDPFMTILLPIMMYFGSQAVGGRGIILGGAKPVPVNPRNYRNFKRGDIVVSLAGIATNIFLAIVCVPLIILVGLIAKAVSGIAEPASIFQLMLSRGIQVNLFLAAFNLLPIPPLDGSHVMKYLLPPQWSLAYQRLGRYGIIILLAFLYLGSPILSLWFAPVFAVMESLFGVVAPYVLTTKWTM
jgi:Zn-dependent protease